MYLIIVFSVPNKIEEHSIVEDKNNSKLLKTNENNKILNNLTQSISTTTSPPKPQCVDAAGWR